MLFSTLRNNKFFYPILLVLIGIVTHLVWLDPFSVLTFSDWSYWHSTPVKELWYSWGAWVGFFNSGAPNVQVPFIVFNGVWSLLVHLGFTFDQAVKVTFLLPIALLGFLSPYVLFNKFFKRPIVAFIAALFYGSTTYFLVKQAGHLPIAFVYSIAPLLVYALWSALERSSIRRWVAFALLYCVGLGYEVRIMVIVTVVLIFFYAIYYLPETGIRRMRLLQISLISLTLACLSAFWILPSLLNVGAINAVAGRGLFGDFLFDLAHALTLSEFSWTGGTPSNSFVLQPILGYMWLLPITAFAAFLFYRRFDAVERRTLILFGSLALIGVFLTKQSTAPFDVSYQWFYDNVPGFSLFREASKFYLLTALGYAGLISLTALGLERAAAKRFRQPALIAIPIVIVVALSFVNLAPLALGRFGTMFVPRHMPDDYRIYNDYIDKQPEFFRTLWLPTHSHWGIFSNKHPVISAADEVSGEWRGLLDFDSHSGDWLVQDQMATLMQQSYTQKLMRDASVKYVVVPLRDTANDDDFFVYYGNNRETYTKLLDGIPWLKRVDTGTKELAVYENTDYAPQVSVSSSAIQVNQAATMDSMYAFLNNTGYGNAALLTRKQPFAGIQTATSLFNATKLTVKDATSIQDVYTSVSGGSAVLYKDTSAALLGYQTSAKSMTFYAHNLSDPSLAGTSITFPNSTSDQTLAKLPLKSGSDYYLSLDGKLEPIAQNKNVLIGDSTQYKDVSVYKLGASLVPDASFETGSWKQTVDDCNNYDDHPDISMSLNRTSYLSGHQSLQLEAARHTACTSTTFSVVGGQKAVFQLAYQGGDAKQAGYYILFNDPNKTVVSDILPITDRDWHTLVKAITIPNGATSASLALYAYESDGVTRNIVRYDNASLDRIELVGAVPLPSSSLKYVSTGVNLQKGDNTFTYSQPNINSDNQIVNGSFENGLWTAKVGDCNNYDSHAVIGHRLNTEQATGSRQSLQLDATRHNACESTSFAVNVTGDQLLSFDYRSPNAKQAGYYLSFNDPHHTFVTAQLPIGTLNQWQHFQRRVIIPDNATTASLALYAYQSDGYTDNTVLYDTVSLNKTPDATDSFYLLTGTQQLAAPKTTAVTYVNPTKKIITLSSASKPFILSSSEAYNDGWKLYPIPLDKVGECQTVREYTAPGNEHVKECADNVKFAQSGDIALAKATTVFDAEHLVVDRYANGWLVDPAYIRQHLDSRYYRENPDGSIDMAFTMYYRPQSYYYLGLIVTGGAIGILTIALLADVGLRAWRRRNA